MAYQLNIPDKTYKNIKLFCQENKIDDIDSILLKIIDTGFNIMKYGVSPFKKPSPIVVEEVKTKKVKEEKQEELETVEIKPKTKKVRIIKK